MSAPEETPAVVTAVSVVHALRDGFYHRTAIDKRPVSGPVHVGAAGVDGDDQIDERHGGPDRAVYVYADEDAAWWADRLGREIPPGLFGDNVRTTGLDVTGARFGERWRLGDDLVLEVRRIRTPCENLALRMELPRFHLDFVASGRTGAMCRVVEGGDLAAGDAVETLLRPDHPVTVGTLASGTASSQDFQRLLDSGLPLAPSVRSTATRATRRA